MKYCVPILLVCCLMKSRVNADETISQQIFSKIPVKELTVFKDGHVYLVHQGKMPTDKSGNVVLDSLPNPVLGTFWPFVVDKRATIQSVVAGKRRVKVERTAMTVKELIEANLGAEVLVTEAGKSSYQAKIVRILSRSAEELAATSPGIEDRLTLKGNLVLLKTIDGTKAVLMDQITDVKFPEKMSTKIVDEEIRHSLTLNLDWNGAPPATSVEVGMAYVQKGIRWIPSYRIEMDGKGKAVAKLQATLLNELVDLNNTTVNLVVGVPSFYFKDTADPIAMSQALAQLSTYFQTDASTHYALSNSMMTQVARGGEVSHGRPMPPGANPANIDLGPALPASGSQNEDLFVFSIQNVTLHKSHRMIVPVSTSTIDYRDIYTLEIPYGFPSELRKQAGTTQAAELAKLMSAPKVTHKIRLQNGDKQPFTTAPALILKDGKLISQSMMTFASRGGSVDLVMGTAVDIRVKKSDKEVKRTPNAESFQGNSLWRTDLASSVELTNQSGKEIEVEVTRFVLGSIDGTSPSSKSDRINVLEEDENGTPIYHHPEWWAHYSWPEYWLRVNPVSRVSWTAKLSPRQSNEQTYSWHYFWK